MIPLLPAPYVEHLVAPRGVGDVTLAMAAGEVGSMVGGGGVRVTLAWRDAGRGRAVVGEVLARTFGSHALVAPASMLTTLAQGLGEDDAPHLTAAVLAEALSGPAGAGRLPVPVQKACESVAEAWRRALGVSANGRPADPLGVGVLVCRCLGVGDRQIRLAVRQGARDPEAVGARCRAGTGCRSCRSDVLTLIDEETQVGQPRPDPARPDVERIVLACGGPLLRSLGVGLRDARVTSPDHVGIAVEALRAKPDLHLPGGALAVVRTLLRETVGPDVGVVALDGARPASS